METLTARLRAHFQDADCVIGEIIKENLEKTQLLLEYQRRYADAEHDLTNAEAEQLFAAQQVDADEHPPAAPPVDTTYATQPVDAEYAVLRESGMVEYPTAGVFEEVEQENPWAGWVEGNVSVAGALGGRGRGP